MTLPLIKLVAVTYNDMVCALMYGKCMTLIQGKMYDIAISSISGNVIHLCGMSTDTMENV
jgi:hypothetical protein